MKEKVAGSILSMQETATYAGCLNPTVKVMEVEKEK